MATYKYVAKSAAGQDVVGQIEADSEAAAARALDERSLFPVRLAVEAPRHVTLLGRRIKARHVGVFYGQLADLLQAGVPLLRALDTVAEAATDARLAELVRTIRDEVAAGKALADALAAHPQAFSPLHWAMVRAGERAGFLEDVLANLSQFIERQDELRSKLRGAMIYPLVVSSVGFVIVTVVLVAFVPQFKPLLASAPKPLPTQMLFGASDMLSGHPMLLAGVVVLAAIAVRALLSGQAGKRMWERWRLKLPVFGRVSNLVSVTRFCRVLGTMLGNGVPIVEALEISKDATGCSILGECVAKAAESVRAGERLADPLRASGLFPAEVVEMIAVAEESNRLEKVLVQIAETIDRRTSRRIDMAVRLIEPLVLVVLAAAVGFVAVGLLYPIFTMSQALQR